MIDLLDKVNEKYLDDFLGMLPPHRILVFLLSIPLVLNLNNVEQGVLVSYMTITPLSALAFEGGILWKQPWLAFILIMSVSCAAIFGASVIKSTFIAVVGRSKAKKEYLIRILESAKSITAETADTSQLEEALLEKLGKRQKQLQGYARLSETLFAASCLFLCFYRIWQPDDYYCFSVVTSLGLLIEVHAQRYYVASVAPTMLLHGYLTGRIRQLEDGYQL